ncbi:MAG: TOBE domain-containing protein [Thermodesulfobacteriota bacterium]
MPPRRRRPHYAWYPTATRKERMMKFGARNKLMAKVVSVKKGDVMSLVKFTVTAPASMASVLTTESVEELDIKVGDELELAIKAVHVLPLKND